MKIKQLFLTAVLLCSISVSAQTVSQNTLKAIFKITNTETRYSAFFRSKTHALKFKQYLAAKYKKPTYMATGRDHTWFYQVYIKDPK